MWVDKEWKFDLIVILFGLGVIGWVWLFANAI